MNPIRAAVERPHTVAVAYLLVVLFSVLALQRIPVQLKPTVDVPRVNVTTIFRGASAVEVEEQVTRELEDVLQSVSGLDELSSTSSEGQSSITLEFGLDTDVQLAMTDVVTKLAQVPPLPDEAEEPVAAIASSTDREMVMWMVVQSNQTPEEVRRAVQDDILARIERVQGVSSVMVAGGAEREVQVRVDPDKLVARGVTFDELLSAIAAGNQNLRGGTVETASRQLVVRTIGKAVVPAELERLIVKETAGGSVLLGEVADVVDGYQERTGFLKMNGKYGVALGVRREVGANVVEITRDLDALRAELNQGFLDRGVDLWLSPVYRETDYIDEAIGFVKNNLVVGAALAIGVLLVFLRSLRSILVVAVTIPVSLVSVFLVMNALGRTLNVISLAGIAFASGMVVDNAIVVLENVFRHLEMGKRPREAAIDGGKEVWGGVLASTLTTVAVFVPILLQRDEASQLFKDMALAISAAVAASLAAALTIVPVLCSLLFRSARAVPSSEEAAARGLFARGYAAFCTRLANPRPGSFGVKLGFVLVVVAASLLSIELAPSAEYLPTGNRNMVMFFADPIPGTKPETVAENYRPFEQFVMAQPEFLRMFAVSGGFNGGGIILKPEYADNEALTAFTNKLFFGMTLPGWRFFVPVRSSIFQDPGKQFEVELSGPDLDTLEAASKRLEQRIGALEGVTSVRGSLVTGRPELHVEVDEQKAKDLGLDVAAVGRVVETVIAGRRMTTMIDRGREVDVNVLAPQWRIESPEALEELTFLAPDGQAVALGSVAHVTRTTGPQSIQRLERERNVLLTVNIAPEAPLSDVVGEVEQQVFPDMFRELGPSYTLAVGGSADKLKTTLEALTSGLGLSVLIIYLLLVSLFRSWLLPGVILVTVPLALSGGVLGIRVAAALTNGAASFDVIAMLGFVILAGLVVNNAILIVHQANNFREEGMDARHALAESARTRLRPIAMSVITTVFGMLPLAAGGGAGAELYQGLGAVIVGGLVVSTLFTLFLVPVLLSLGHDLGVGTGRVDSSETAPVSSSAPEPAVSPS
ncbi:MAG: efflux RND transporter permease subunit [Planctomycetes bacterium]|nr:efflux RND transporter permease subunit [Planctomycetota bacterium]